MASTVLYDEKTNYGRAQLTLEWADRVQKAVLVEQLIADESVFTPQRPLTGGLLHSCPFCWHAFTGSYCPFCA